MTKNQICSWYLSLIFIFYSGIAFSTERCDVHEDNRTQHRLISIGGANTEILFALGLGECITAVDTSSTYPEKTTSMPKVGYMRALSAEPILALKPTLILLDEGAGPEETVKQLKRFYTPLLQLPKPNSFETLMATISLIGEQTQSLEASIALQKKISDEIETLNRYLRGKNIHDFHAAPRIAFLMNLESREVLLAGKRTAADSMIHLAGGRNIVSDFTGYKTVSSEALMQLDPDIIISTYRAVKSLGIARTLGRDEALQKLSALPTLKFTRAAKEKKIFLFDTQYLLGFGPRSAKAALNLAKAIHHP